MRVTVNFTLNNGDGDGTGCFKITRYCKGHEYEYDNNKIYGLFDLLKLKPVSDRNQFCIRRFYAFDMRMGNWFRF